MSSVPERGESGEFQSDRSDEILEAMPINEPVIASELSDQTGIPRTTVNYHLNKLADDGRISKKKFHSRRVVWLRHGE